jgi:hypothetical protein
VCFHHQPGIPREFRRLDHLCPRHGAAADEARQRDRSAQQWMLSPLDCAAHLLVPEGEHPLECFKRGVGIWCRWG